MTLPTQASPAASRLTERPACPRAVPAFRLLITPGLALGLGMAWLVAAIPATGGEPPQLEPDSCQEAAENQPTEQVQLLREKLLSSQGARIPGESLKQALDQLAEDFGFQYEFDPAALRETGVDPESAEVTINVRRRKLIGILREILAQHRLRPVLEGAVIRVVALPVPPEGQKRVKVNDDAPLESLVDGQIVVVPNTPAATSPDDSGDPAEEAAPDPGLNEPLRPDDAAGEGSKEQEKALRQQFEGQFQPALQGETRLVIQAIGDNADLHAPLREAGKTRLAELVNQQVRAQLRAMRGWAGSNPPNFPNLTVELRKTFEKVLEAKASAEVLERYRLAVRMRVERRQQATIRGLVAQLDRIVLLSADQRRDCEQLLRENWQPGHARYLELLQHDGNHWFPKDVTPKLAMLLSADQLKLWEQSSPNDIGVFWGWAGEQFQVFSGVVNRADDGDTGDNNADAADAGGDGAQQPVPLPRGEGITTDEPGATEPEGEANAEQPPQAAILQNAIPLVRIQVQARTIVAPAMAPPPIDDNDAAEGREAADGREAGDEPQPQPAVRAVRIEVRPQPAGPGKVVIEQGPPIQRADAEGVERDESGEPAGQAVETTPGGTGPGGTGPDGIGADGGAPAAAAGEAQPAQPVALPLVQVQTMVVQNAEGAIENVEVIAPGSIDVRVEVEPGAEIKPEDDWDDLDRPQLRRQPMEAVIDESNFEAWIWQGRASTLEEGRRSLERQLAVRLADLKRVSGLSDEQVQRLKLAAAVDMERFFAEYRALRQRFLRDRITPNGMNNFWEALQPLQSRITGGLFDQSSFFRRFAPRALSGEQLSQFHQSELDRQTYRARARLDLVLVAAEEALGLTNEQATQFNEAARETLVVTDKVHPQFDLYATLLRMERIPQATLETILEPGQLRMFRLALAQFQGLKPMLKDEGLVVDESPDTPQAEPGQTPPEERNPSPESPPESPADAGEQAPADSSPATPQGTGPGTAPTSDPQTTDRRPTTPVSSVLPDLHGPDWSSHACHQRQIADRAAPLRPRHPTTNDPAVVTGVTHHAG